MFSLPTLERKCGSCTECCHILGVVELGKPYYVACVHERPKNGCACHKTKPDSCSQWECAWLQGGLPDDLRFRPDFLGVMFVANHADGHIWLEVFEAKPGCLGKFDGDKGPEINPVIIAIVERIMGMHPEVCGVRFYQFGTRVNLAYGIAPEYPDEGEGHRRTEFYSYDDSRRILFAASPVRQHYKPKARGTPAATTPSTARPATDPDPLRAGS